jgi:hypothetical protein
VRTTAPEIGMGLMTREELYDSEREGRTPATSEVMKRLVSGAVEAATEPHEAIPWDQSIADATTTENVYGILAEIDDDDAIEKDEKERLVSLAKERIEALKA